MVRPEDVKHYIEQGLACDHVEVAGKRRVQQHQLVYRALGERMREEIHALSMQTYTPEDWAAAGR